MVRTSLTTSYSVLTSKQKQARMGWSTMHMDTLYTDVISSEDRRAADHIGFLLDEPGGVEEPASCSEPAAEAPST